MPTPHYGFSERQIQLAKDVRRFVEQECSRQSSREAEEAKEFREELWEKLIKKGWSGLTIPREYGGTGETIMELCVVFEELAKGFFEGAARFMGDLVFGGHIITAHSGESQKNLLLPELAKGKMHFSIALTEPSGGSDLLSLSTTADPDDGAYRLNGSKMFVTLAHKVDYIIPLAITDPNAKAAKKTQGLSFFLVPSDSPGLRIRRLDTVGWGVVGTNEVFLNDVRVPAENVLGELNMGWDYIVGSLNYERIGFAAMMVGIAQTVFDDVLNYVKEKQVSGRPIGQSQVVQQALGQVAIEIENARLHVYRAAWLDNIGKQCDVEAAMALSIGAATARNAAIEGMRITGEDMYLEEYDIYDLMRQFTTAKPLAVVPFSNEMRLIHIAESYGLPRSY